MEKACKRDISMLVPQAQIPAKYEDRTDLDSTQTPEASKPSKYVKGITLREDELVIMLDPEHTDTWVLAEVLEKYDSEVKFNYYSTPTPALHNHAQASPEERRAHLKLTHFRKTWFVNSGAHNGRGTIKPPFPNNPDLRLWTETVPTEEYEALLLIRDAQLSSRGQLSDATIKLIAHNKTPQAHITTVDDDPPVQGASGEEDNTAVTLASFFTYPHNFALCALCKCNGNTLLVRACDKGHLSKTPLARQGKVFVRPVSCKTILIA